MHTHSQNTSISHVAFTCSGSNYIPLSINVDTKIYRDLSKYYRIVDLTATVTFFLHRRTLCNLIEHKALVVHRENFLITVDEVFDGNLLKS